MDLKERLKKIMAEEFGITTDAQLNEAYENLDLSVYGIFTQKGAEHEKGDSSKTGNNLGVVNAV